MLPGRVGQKTSQGCKTALISPFRTLLMAMVIVMLKMLEKGKSKNIVTTTHPRQIQKIQRIVAKVFTGNIIAKRKGEKRKW